MGGYSHIIEGVIREEALKPKTSDKGFWGRLFGGAKRDRIHRNSFGDSVLIDVPCRGLSKRVHDHFISYLRQKLPQPNEATASIFDYLDIAKTDVYIRGEEKSGSCSWSTQVSFSGCAGMADVSAEVCSHWAAIWTEEHLEDFVKPLLSEYGFEVNEQDEKSQIDYSFIRVKIDGQHSYAAIESDGSIGLDGSFYEYLAEDYEQFDKRMQELYGHKASLKECECQLCQQR